MEFVIDFLPVGDGDAIVIWARVPNSIDYVFFLDGGNSGHGQKIVDHYNEWIKPHLYQDRIIAFINSHPHADHINGLIEVVELLKGELNYAIYNDPVKCITEEHRQRIYQHRKEDTDIEHLYEMFEEIDKLNALCAKHNIQRIDALQKNLINGTDAIKILSPSEGYYVNQVQYFSDIDFLKAKDFSKKITDVDEDIENLVPCDIVDAADDTSPENLTSTVIQLTDGQGRRYILTGDAGKESFDYMESEGFVPGNIRFVQLPHHGSRRNISTAWVKKFSPDYFLASAEGNKHHPRRALINCIKRNVPACGIYSTHNGGGTLSLTTDKTAFPKRGWGKAKPL